MNSKQRLSVLTIGNWTIAGAGKWVNDVKEVSI